MGFVDAVSTLTLDSRTKRRGEFVDVSRLDEIPQPWRQAMENAGTYSIRELATKAGVGTSTASDLIYGRKRTSEATMQAVSDSLRLPPTTIREWAATARGEARPFRLPPEANRLTKREREAVLAVVRAMLDPGEDESDELPAPDLSKVQGIRLAEETSPTLQAVDTPTDQ